MRSLRRDSVIWVAAAAVTVLLTLLLAVSCGGTRSASTIRLVEAFTDDAVEGRAVEVAEIEPTRWQGAELAAFKAENGIAGFRTGEAGLTGRSTSAAPILTVERTSGLDNPDVLHAVEIRMKASAGSELFVSFSNEAELDLKPLVARTLAGDGFAWALRTPIVADETVKTYTLSAAEAFNASFPASGIRHVLVRPTDAEAASFEIESVRLIFRREYLRNIPSGIGWHGLNDVFRETLVSRAPERVSFDVDLGADPWLDLSLGTVEEGAVTFRIEAADSVDAEGEVLLERTLTTPHRWELTPVDLGAWANRSLVLRFSLVGADEGTLGFWGAPVVRSRTALAQGRPRGVILIIGDTLRRDHVDSYGYGRPTAPQLAELATRGVLFADNQSQATWTKVSVPSILSSLYPTTHGISSVFHRLSVGVDTIAETYQRAGYATWASSSVPFSGKMTNLHQGVEELYERSALADGGSKTARGFVDQLLPWIEAHAEGPFFARLHVFDPHSPFRPRSPYDTMFTEEGEAEAFAEDVEKLKEHIEDESRRNRVMPYTEELEKAGLDPEKFVAFEHKWYDGSIRGMDAEIARLMERLTQLGIADDVMVAFISDHGEEFLEHGRHWHGNTVYGEMTNVPLILSWPNGIPAGQVIDETVQSIDLMPTLLELSGIPIPDNAQGQSLVPLLIPGGDPSHLRGRAVFSERRADETQTNMAPTDSLAIVADGWKLIHNVRRTDDMPEFELYDHGNDPLNLSDVAEANPDVVGKLAARLDEWLQMAEAAKEAIGAEAENFSPEELERLRSLGYIR